MGNTATTAVAPSSEGIIAVPEEMLTAPIAAVPLEMLIDEKEAASRTPVVPKSRALMSQSIPRALHSSPIAIASVIDSVRMRQLSTMSSPNCGSLVELNVNANMSRVARSDIGLGSAPRCETPHQQTLRNELVWKPLAREAYHTPQKSRSISIVDAGQKADLPLIASEVRRVQEAEAGQTVREETPKRECADAWTQYDGYAKEVGRHRTYPRQSHLVTKRTPVTHLTIYVLS